MNLKSQLPMKHSVLLFLLSIFSSLLSFAQFPPTDASYKLVFQDEFDSVFQTSPKLIIADTSKWDRVFPWNQCCNQFFNTTDSTWWDLAYIMHADSDSSTVRINNGTLKLLTSNLTVFGDVSNWPPCDSTNDSTLTGLPCLDDCRIRGIDTIPTCSRKDTLFFRYRTGMLWSKQQFRYGYFETRFKLPAGDSTTKGMGPCFWLWSGDHIIGNLTSEIDVFEINAFKSGPGHSNWYTCNVHYADTAHPADSSQTFSFGNMPSSNVWYKAAAWWTPTYIRFYLDDKLIHDFPCAEKGVYPDKMAAINIIVETNSPATNFKTNFDTLLNQFPYTFEIDYVRVYQLNVKCDTDSVYCNSNAGTFESGLYKSLTIGGSGCVDTFTAGAKITGLGTDYVLLDEGLMLDGTSEAYFDVIECFPNQYIGRQSIPNPPDPPSYYFLKKRGYIE